MLAGAGKVGVRGLVDVLSGRGCGLVPRDEAASGGVGGSQPFTLQSLGIFAKV